MSRLPRFNCPDIPQHVVQRGNNRQAVFFDDSDYLAYLEEIGGHVGFPVKATIE